MVTHANSLSTKGASVFIDTVDRDALRKAFRTPKLPDVKLDRFCTAADAVGLASTLAPPMKAIASTTEF